MCEKYDIQTRCKAITFEPYPFSFLFLTFDSSIERQKHPSVTPFPYIPTLSSHHEHRQYTAHLSINKNRSIHRWLVRFVDIGGFIDHSCLNFLFIIYQSMNCYIWMLVKIICSIYIIYNKYVCSACLLYHDGQL